MRYRLFIYLILLALLASSYFMYVYYKSSRSTESQKANVQRIHNPLPTVKMNKVEYTPDREAIARSRENPPFELRGQGSSRKVIDREGKILMESGEDIGIFGIGISPDKNHVLVKGGDSVNFILNPSIGLKIQLPVYPPGENMFGLGWDWLDSNRLLGSSGVQILDTKGNPINSCGAPNVAQTKLYVYDLTTKKLAEVTMPSSIIQPVVTVVDVIDDGHIHLIYENPHGSANKDLGWFKIEN